MLVIRSTRVILPDGERPATIHVDNDTIALVGDYRDHPYSATLIDVGDHIVSPGIVDTHVHVNEPGRADWEGFDTATRAAAAGGVTTIVDMPLNSVPATTTVAALAAKREAARSQCHVDVAFWGGVVPGNTDELDPMADAGVRGFKCFLVPSGVDEFPAVDDGDLRRALPILARRRLPLLVHAESPKIINSQSSIGSLQSPIANRQSYASYLASRPAAAELDAVLLMIDLAREFSAHVHIVHVSSVDGAAAIANARTRGLRVTAETCPHYLTFTSADVPDGGTLFKCAPPIRDAAHREALWHALETGALDLVATDHSPSPPALKCPGDFPRAWGGIASLELALPATWTGARARGRTPADLARWLSAAPASLAGLRHRKGVIAPGRDADFAIWEPDAERTVDPARLQQRHKITPYAGTRLRGTVRSTFVRGRRVWDDGRLLTAGAGELL